MRSALTEDGCPLQLRLMQHLPGRNEGARLPARLGRCHTSLSQCRPQRPPPDTKKKAQQLLSLFTFWARYFSKYLARP
jgi:hypothetical protein